MTTCEDLCLSCPNKGLFPVNFANYHKVCPQHIPFNNPLLTCTRCSSTVISISDFFICTFCNQSYIAKICPCGQQMCESCLNVCQLCTQSFCPKCLDSNSTHCQKCKEYLRVYCQICRNPKQSFCASCRKHNCDPKKFTCSKCKKDFCSSCAQNSQEKKFLCIFCNPGKKEDLQNDSKTLPVRHQHIENQIRPCDQCNSKENCLGLVCGHYFCLKCNVLNYSTCKKCINIKAMQNNGNSNERNKKALTSPKSALAEEEKKKSSKMCSLCFKNHEIVNKYKNKFICGTCYEEYYSQNKKYFCSNCGESASPETFSCNHKGCEECCKLNEMCFECFKIKKNAGRQSMAVEICKSCKVSSKCITLFCKHTFCSSCFTAKNFKTINFVCNDCIVSIEKLCLSCHGLAIWLKDDNSKYLKSLCCRERTICGKCLKEKSRKECSCEP